MKLKIQNNIVKIDLDKMNKFLEKKEQEKLKLTEKKIDRRTLKKKQDAKWVHVKFSGKVYEALCEIASKDGSTPSKIASKIIVKELK